MFRRLLALTCALAVVGALSWGANAAPISGSFAIDIVFYPQHGEDDPINKVDLIDMKFEADLILTLSISGLDITSTTVFTFLGVEFQSFVISATVGALTIKDTLIFSPTFFEFEEMRDQFGRLRWCVQDSRPPHNLAGDSANCYYPSYGAGTDGAGHTRYGGLLAHIDDDDFGAVPFWYIFRGVIHPLVQNLVLARWIDTTVSNPLNDTIRFRKKIADLSLNIAGLVLNVRALFANVDQNPTGYTLRSGLVMAMEGKTVSGVGVRGELWLGAKQGLECFGECKPLERFFNQMVTGGGFLNPEEEKVFLSNVVIAGVRHDFRAEFHFDLTNWDGGTAGDDPALPNLFQCGIDQVDNDNDGWFGEDPTNGVDDDLDGVVDEDDMDVISPLCYMQLTQTFVVAPWRLNVQTTWNWNGDLDLLSNTTNVQLKFGDMSVTAYLYYRASAQWSFTAGLGELVTSFDPPGLTVTSDILFCTNLIYCAAPNALQPGFLPPVLEHDLSFTGTVGPMSIAALAIFDGGIFGDFAELDVDMSFSTGPVTVVFSTVLLVDQLGGAAISLSTKF